MYEDEGENFCCGRGYGESRVACASMFRYHLAADIEQDVVLEHAWPVSHFSGHVESLCTDAQPLEEKVKSRSKQKNFPQGALSAAMDLYPRDSDLMTIEAVGLLQ